MYSVMELVELDWQCTEGRWAQDAGSLTANPPAPLQKRCNRISGDGGIKRIANCPYSYHNRVRDWVTNSLLC